MVIWPDKSADAAKGVFAATEAPASYFAPPPNRANSQDAVTLYIKNDISHITS
jgi:hypothetical protein